MKTTRKKIAPKIYAAEAVWLDPLGCDSTIAYKVIKRSRRPWATVQLADCQRKIEWYFGGDKAGLAKLDKAIAALQACRAMIAGIRPVVRRAAKKVKE
jgi:hypothetical protein